MQLPVVFRYRSTNLNQNHMENETILTLAYLRVILAHQAGTCLKSIDEAVVIVERDLDRIAILTANKFKLQEAKDAINFDHVNKLANMSLRGYLSADESYSLKDLKEYLGEAKSVELLNFAVTVWRDNPNMQEGTPFEWNETPDYKFCWVSQQLEEHETP